MISVTIAAACLTNVMSTWMPRSFMVSLSSHTLRWNSVRGRRTWQRARSVRTSCMQYSPSRSMRSASFHHTSEVLNIS